MKLNVLFAAAALTLGCALSAHAATATHAVTTFADANSTGGGTGADTFFSVTAGDQFTVSTTATQFWEGANDGNAAALYSNANGSSFNWVGLNGISGNVDIGTLVAEIGGEYRIVGAGVQTFTAWNSGELFLAYADINKDDNSGSITSDVTAPVPEPANIALLFAGLGMLGLVARRRSQK